ncbi:uncharacterized protein B4U80_11788 [Leptotrombidium deliense]|uniref:HAT C-terminal dimerisation domain-containing protein n=1 Tax=Leptotrombidium deliense TaxID=299467 RepID=A0A443S2F9_9ACAR|nr:uncharacterized protein B4U80_11788 [Leptotrombidium deliense]
MESTLNILKEFGIDDKDLVFVTDNAIAMKSAFKNKIWMGCSSHNLNLVQKHAFKDLNGILEPIKLLLHHAKELVTWSKRSKDVAELKTTLKQCIEVRWDSRYNMLQSISDNYLSLKELIRKKPTGKVAEHLQYIPEDILKKLLFLLEPLKTTRISLCQEKEATIHLVLPAKMFLLEFYGEMSTDEAWEAELKKRIRIQLKQYLLIHQLHQFALLLLPSHRGMNKIVTAAEREDLIEKLILVIGPDTPVSTSETQESRTCSSRNILASFRDASASNSAGLGEVRRYMAAFFNEEQQDLAPSKFWHTQKHVFPKLAAYANHLFSIPATNLSSERNFNYASLTISDRRSRLEPLTVDKLLFLRANC